MNEHELKIWPVYYNPVLAGEKTFEIRDNRDRDFKSGDQIVLREWDPDLKDYTGRSVKGEITYVTDYGQQPGFVVFSFKKHGAEAVDEEMERRIKANSRRLAARVGASPFIDADEHSALSQHGFREENDVPGDDFDEEE